MDARVFGGSLILIMTSIFELFKIFIIKEPFKIKLPPVLGFRTLQRTGWVHEGMDDLG
jgi:hypothetical protein